MKRVVSLVVPSAMSPAGITCLASSGMATSEMHQTVGRPTPLAHPQLAKKYCQQAAAGQATGLKAMIDRSSRSTHSRRSGEWKL